MGRPTRSRSLFPFLKRRSPSPTSPGARPFVLFFFLLLFSQICIQRRRTRRIPYNNHSYAATAKSKAAAPKPTHLLTHCLPQYNFFSDLLSAWAESESESLSEPEMWSKGDLIPKLWKSGRTDDGRCGRPPRMVGFVRPISPEEPTEECRSKQRQPSGVVGLFWQITSALF